MTQIDTIDDLLASDEAQHLVEQLDDFAGVVKDGWILKLMATVHQAIAIGYEAGERAGRIEAAQAIRRSHLSEN